MQCFISKCKVQQAYSKVQRFQNTYITNYTRERCNSKTRTETWLLTCKVQHRPLNGCKLTSNHCRAIKERVFNNQKQMELPVPDLYFHRQETRQESYMGKGIVVREDSEMFMNINWLIDLYLTPTLAIIQVYSGGLWPLKCQMLLLHDMI